MKRLAVRKIVVSRILLFALVFSVIFFHSSIMVLAREETKKDSERPLGGYVETFDASTNPWDILAGRSSVQAGILAIGGDTFLLRIFSLLRHTFVIVCIIGCLMSLLTVPFIQNAKAIGEKKEDLTHKAFLFALSFAIFPILNSLKTFMDSQFGIW